MYTADTLSRAPQAITELEDIAGEADSFAEAYVNHLPASKHRLEEYSQAQVEDPICSQVIGYCYQGWPSKHRVNLALQPYWRVREELTVVRTYCSMVPRSFVIKLWRRFMRAIRG